MRLIASEEAFLKAEHEHHARVSAAGEGTGDWDRPAHQTLIQTKRRGLLLSAFLVSISITLGALSALAISAFVQPGPAVVSAVGLASLALVAWPALARIGFDPRTSSNGTLLEETDDTGLGSLFGLGLYLGSFALLLTPATTSASTTETEGLATKDVVVASGILLTFTIGVANLIFSYLNARKTRFINTVTTQRVQWIEQLRQDIAAYIAAVSLLGFGQADDDPDGALERAYRLSRTIRLRLNPNACVDGKIESLLTAITAELQDETSPATLSALLDQLTTLAQALIKNEWEKVKQEAAHGRLETDGAASKRR